MSTNTVNICEDAEMSDCDGEKVVTMMDVLKEQEDFEEDANAVLGASDDKNCTYLKGYIKRQAIYACMTCCAESKNDPSKWAGVCLACSLSCHENHELVELYTKRNFRCDCGNPKFNSHPCQFTPNKTDINVDNIYNQNFSGVYCVCHRPYPDPESSRNGDMIQCIICEDWLHSNHLDAVVPSNEQYSEMICKACMDKNKFLHDYSNLVVNKENMDIDILNTTSKDNIVANCFENPSVEAVEIDHIVDSVASKPTKNDSIAEKVTDDHDTQHQQQCHSEAKSCNKNKVEENFHNKDDLKTNELSSSRTSESGVISDNHNFVEKTNALSINEKNTEIKPNNVENSDMSTIMSDQRDGNSNQKLVSQKDGEPIPSQKRMERDSRSLEQVEEDLLLADPIETELEQNKKVTTTLLETNLLTTDGSKMKSNFKLVNTSEAANDDQVEKAACVNNLRDRSQSDNASNAEKSKDVTISEQLENKPIADQAENVTVVENTDKTPCKDIPFIEHAQAKGSKFTVNSKQQQNTPLTQHDITMNLDSSHNEQSGTVSTNEQSEAITSKAVEDVSTVEQADDIADISMGQCQIDKSTDAVTNETNTDNNILHSEIKTNTNHNDEPVKRKLSTDSDTENVEMKKPKLEDSKCVKPKGVKKMYHGATFWPSNFRHKLCTCNECISMYKDLSVLFLIDPDDTVTAYERLGQEKTDGKPASQYEKGMEALSSLGRVQQINALTEYTKLKDKLLEFLKTFKDKKVIVKEEDIKAFFAGMKPVREPDGVYFCR